ncbi:hypothetical protein KFE98_19655 [bacterium SCSIO 12741]|nr:hypothetical protein KFE98_19655 [bacterium SCSIO 12741]
MKVLVVFVALISSFWGWANDQEAFYRAYSKAFSGDEYQYRLNFSLLGESDQQPIDQMEYFIMKNSGGLSIRLDKQKTYFIKGYLVNIDEQNEVVVLSKPEGEALPGMDPSSWEHLFEYLTIDQVKRNNQGVQYLVSINNHPLYSHAEFIFDQEDNLRSVKLELRAQSPYSQQFGARYCQVEYLQADKQDFDGDLSLKNVFTTENPPFELNQHYTQYQLIQYSDFEK